MTTSITPTIPVNATTKENAINLLKKVFEARDIIKSNQTTEKDAKEELIRLYDMLASVADVNNGDEGYLFDVGNAAQYAKILKKITPAGEPTTTIDMEALALAEPKLFARISEQYKKIIPGAEAKEAYDIRMVNKVGTATVNSPLIREAAQNSASSPRRTRRAAAATAATVA